MVGSQTTWSSMPSVTSDRERDTPGRGRSRSPVSHRRPPASRPPRDRGQPGNGARRGTGQERLTVLHPTGGRAAWRPGGEHVVAVLSGSGSPGSVCSARRAGRGRPRRTHPGAQRLESRSWISRRVRVLEELTHLAGEHVEGPVVADRRCWPGPARTHARDPPSRRTSRPSRPGPRPASTTSATAVTADSRSLEGDRRTPAARAVGGRADRADVDRVDSTDDEGRPISPVAAAASMMPAVSRAGVSGRPRDLPHPRHLAAGGLFADGTSAGKQRPQGTGLERTTLSGPAGHPRHAGPLRGRQISGRGERAGQRWPAAHRRERCHPPPGRRRQPDRPRWT